MCEAPISAKGSGGRHFRGNNVDQNFDSYSVEYTFGDGAKLFLEGRTIQNCQQLFASYAHGTKGSAVISANTHNSGRCPVYQGQKMSGKPVWRAPRAEPSPYQVEWDRLIEAIRKDKPHNEAKRGTEASLVTVMGRLAAHTGRVWTYDQTLNHPHEFAPDVDKLTLTGPAPVQADKDGKYPVPRPGVEVKREY